MRQDKKIVVLLSLLFFIQVLYAQRWNAGINYDLFSTHISTFASGVLAPDNQKAGYYIDHLQISPRLAFCLGGNLRMDHPRYFWNFRLAYTTVPLGFMYHYRYPLGEGTSESFYSRLAYNQMEFALSLAYYLRAGGKFRPFFEWGAGEAFPLSFRETVSYDKTFVRLWPERNILGNVMNISDPFPFISFAYGYRSNHISIYLRYMFRNGSYQVFHSVLWLGMSIFTNDGIFVFRDRFRK